MILSEFGMGRESSTEVVRGLRLGTQAFLSPPPGAYHLIAAWFLGLTPGGHR